MDFNSKLIKKLLHEEDTGLKISIYQPTHPASTGQAVQEDTIRFKNALQAIRSSSAYDESVLGETMSSLEKLVDNREFWQNQSLGLAVFADKSGYETVHLNYDVTEAHYLGEQYQLSPLVLMESLSSNYYLLDVNHSRPRLLEGSAAGCSELILEDMPESLDKMMENIEFKKELQHQTSGVGAFHGHNDKAALQDSTMGYYRQIASAVDGYLTGHNEPLILMGVENRVGSLRQFMSYTNTLDDYVEGNVESMSEHELQQQAAPTVEKYHAKHRHEQVEEYNSAPPELSAIGEEEIETIAQEGRVEKLLLPSYRRTTDTVRDETGESIVLQLTDEDVEAEALVRSVLAHGGSVVAVAVDAFEDEQPRALCRF